MAPQDKSQFKKFDNILARISDTIDSVKGDSIEIYDEIKNQLREELNNVYEEWKSSEFNPNFRFKLDDDGEAIETTLLHIAIQCRKSAACVPLIQCLLDQGADPNVQDSPYSSTPLHKAACTKEDENKEVVKLLLARKANPNIVDFRERTPLYIACMFYGIEGFNVEIIELLLTRVEVNQGDNEGNTPLHQLIKTSLGLHKSPILEKQSLELVRTFVEYHASVRAENKNHKTPKGLIEESISSSSSINYKLANSIKKLLEMKEKIIAHLVERLNEHSRKLKEQNPNPRIFQGEDSKKSSEDKGSLLQQADSEQSKDLGIRDEDNQIEYNTSSTSKDPSRIQDYVEVLGPEKPQINNTLKDPIDPKWDYAIVLDPKEPLGGGKVPPPNGQKPAVAIAIGVVAALATALVCYSVELPVLAIAISALIAGVGAYMISSKLYEVVVCNGTSQQPGL
ncbi:ankyrin repeat domain-containing protein [Wolbachia endosymbiont of Oedothorax gibbosus]|uniref:ankyrin repeat domain-containing protein n=1 Tax=Wolbachia endosymbiont of Oedothorax gibbosus TaxID=931100 RepID=UPI0020259F9D|nr:ankyrin repeat domain-containing protein [Wolbachia endosymbiont of Oedothorax gibbosus]